MVELGIRTGFRNRRLKGHEGSIPSFGTKFMGASLSLPHCVKRWMLFEVESGPPF